MSMNTDKRDPIHSIVVPVYNSEHTLLELYERIVRVMEAMGQSFEMVFVEDCGADRSWQVLQAIAQRDERVSAIQLLRNYGQASATLCGLRYAVGQIVVTLDDDLQNPPEEIPLLVRALENDPALDVVIGIPREKQHAFWRRLGSEIVNAINSFAVKKDRSLKFSGFRAMRRIVVDRLVELNVPQPAIGVLLCSITPRIANIAVRHEPRSTGRSGYTIAKILGLTLSNFLTFSDFPLRFLAMVGVVGILASLAYGIVLIVRFAMGGISVPGWTTIALLLIAMSGFSFFAFGLIGEYLLRILQSAQNTPQYVVRQQIEGQAGEDAGQPTSSISDGRPTGWSHSRVGEADTHRGL
jgi:dolichol-phosphate mannosyltransferase/undecaprenyl-phosphate 4-deoxy-4-formamido-L-arabinose transferase